MAAPKPQRIFLASRSPRRRELLRQIGINFELLMFRSGTREDVDLSEDVLADEDPRDYVQRMARMKAEGGWSRLAMRNLPKAPVLSADTTVSLNQTIYGKPRDEADAVRILGELAGQTHRVMTAVAVMNEERVETALSVSFVTFRKLGEAEIRRYVATGEPMDKAGAYGIQGKAATFIERIEGSYSGIMGLPLFESAALLAKFGIEGE
jgi:septum formation protein